LVRREENSDNHANFVNSCGRSSSSSSADRHNVDCALWWAGELSVTSDVYDICSVKKYDGKNTFEN